MTGTAIRLLRRLGSRIALALAVLLVSGLLAGALVRMAPGLGMDERLLDARLSADSLQAIERERTGQSDIFGYYCKYLRKLAHGDLGTSLSLGRPVKELLSE